MMTLATEDGSMVQYLKRCLDRVEHKANSDLKLALGTNKRTGHASEGSYSNIQMYSCSRQCVSRVLGDILSVFDI